MTWSGAGERRGDPIWPKGIFGSMTRCTGYRVAAVARGNLTATVGIDAEPHEALPVSGLRYISSQTERAQLAGRRPDVHWDRLIFCSKEAACNAYYPPLRRRLEFTAVRIKFPATEGTFRAELLMPGAVLIEQEVTVFDGRRLIRDGSSSLLSSSVPEAESLV